MMCDTPAMPPPPLPACGAAPAWPARTAKQRASAGSTTMGSLRLRRAAIILQERLVDSAQRSKGAEMMPPPPPPGGQGSAPWPRGPTRSVSTSPSPAPLSCIHCTEQSRRPPPQAAPPSLVPMMPSTPPTAAARIMLAVKPRCDHLGISKIVCYRGSSDLRVSVICGEGKTYRVKRCCWVRRSGLVGASDKLGHGCSAWSGVHAWGCTRHGTRARAHQQTHCGSYPVLSLREGGVAGRAVGGASFGAHGRTSRAAARHRR